MHKVKWSALFSSFGIEKNDFKTIHTFYLNASFIIIALNVLLLVVKNTCIKYALCEENFLK